MIAAVQNGSESLLYGFHPFCFFSIIRLVQVHLYRSSGCHELCPTFFKPFVKRRHNHESI
jgi:hypothetical protein